MRSKKLITIINALEAAARSNGYELVDVELGGTGHHSLVRVFLDKPDGLTLDAVAEANAWVNEVIDELDPFTGSYTLEVSSPGINRPLRTLQHFEQAAGKIAVVSLEPQASNNQKASKDGATSKANKTSATNKTSKVSTPSTTSTTSKPRTNYTGTILGVQRDPDIVLLEADGKAEKLDFLRIKKAHIKGEVSFENRKDA